MKDCQLNTTKVTARNKPRPCHELGFCPYGKLVEEYPVTNKGLSCRVFGHDCPVYYLAEGLCE